MSRKKIRRSCRANPEKIVLGNGENKHGLYVVKAEPDRRRSIRCWEEETVAEKRRRSHAQRAASKLAGKDLWPQHSEERKILVGLRPEP